MYVLVLTCCHPRCSPIEEKIHRSHKILEEKKMKKMKKISKLTKKRRRSRQREKRSTLSHSACTQLCCNVLYCIKMKCTVLYRTFSLFFQSREVIDKAVESSTGLSSERREEEEKKK